MLRLLTDMRVSDCVCLSASVFQRKLEEQIRTMLQNA